MEPKQYYIGIDVGGTSVKEGLFDEDGNLLAKASVPTPPIVDAAGFAAVTEAIDQVVAKAQIPRAFVSGIGLAVPCPIPASGDAKVKANIAINLPELKIAIQEHCPDAVVKYENDANAAAMGEAWLGSAKGVQNVVMVTIGTGVGGGVIVNGDVVSGVVGAGGEIGHMCLNPAEERTCGCGGHGHLEQYSSATGVVSNYLAECKKAGVEPIELTGPSDSKDVFQACREGDKLVAPTARPLPTRARASSTRFRLRISSLAASVLPVLRARAGRNAATDTAPLDRVWARTCMAARCLVRIRARPAVLVHVVDRALTISLAAAATGPSAIVGFRPMPAVLPRPLVRVRREPKSRRPRCPRRWSARSIVPAHRRTLPRAIP